MFTIDSILTLLLSFGGMGAVICAVVKYSAGIIEKTVLKSYQLKMDKELEGYKHNLENKKYVTQTQYDIEFNVYRDITKSLYLVAKTLYSIMDERLNKTRTGKELLVYELEKAKKIIVYVVDLQDKIYENAPFIPQHLFTRYEELSDMANDLIVVLTLNLEKLLRCDSEFKSMEEFMGEEEKQKAKCIIESYKKLNEDLRDYLKDIRITD